MRACVHACMCVYVSACVFVYERMVFLCVYVCEYDCERTFKLLCLQVSNGMMDQKLKKGYLLRTSLLYYMIRFCLTCTKHAIADW